MSRLRYLGLAAARSRAPLVPVMCSLFALVGVYLGRENEVGATWGLTALLCCALAAWLAIAVLASEPRAQADIASTALGGYRGRSALDVLLGVTVAIGLTAAFVAYPLALDLLLGGQPVFDRPVRPGDVVAGALAHLACALLGGAIGVLYSPPRLMRRATSTAAVLASLLALVAVAGAFGAAGGPVALARAMSDARPGSVEGPVISGSVSCLVLAGLALAGAARWGRRAG